MPNASIASARPDRWSWLANEKTVPTLEVKEDKLMLTRHGAFITLAGKFPRLPRKDARARLKEIKKLLLAL